MVRLLSLVGKTYIYFYHTAPSTHFFHNKSWSFSTDVRNAAELYEYMRSGRYVARVASSEKQRGTLRILQGPILTAEYCLQIYFTTGI